MVVPLLVYIHPVVQQLAYIHLGIARGVSGLTLLRNPLQCGIGFHFGFLTTIVSSHEHHNLICLS